MTASSDSISATATGKAMCRSVWPIYFHSFGTIIFVVFVNYSQGFMLVNFYGLETGEIGGYIAKLVLLHECCVLLSTSLWGNCSDIIGRRICIALGWLCLAIGLPISAIGGDIRYYCLARMMIAIGFSNLMTHLTALLADLSDPENIGFITGMSGFFCGVGAVTGSIVFGSFLPARYCLRPTMWIGSLTALAFAITILIGMPKKTSMSSEIVESPADSSKAGREFRDVLEMDEEKPKITSLLRATIRWLRVSPQFCVALYGSLLARASSALIVTFIPLSYIMSSLAENGDHPFDTVALNECGELNYKAMIRGSNAAYGQSARVVGIIHVCTLLFAPFVGTWSRKDGQHLKPLTICAAVSAIIFPALGWFLFSNSKALVYTLSVIAGGADIGLILCSQTLLSAAAKQQSIIRGSMSGLFTFTGSVGILVLTLLGGLLFDIHSNGNDHPFFYLPFFLFGALCLPLVIVVLAKYRNDEPF